MGNKQFLGHIMAMISIFVWGFSYVPIVVLLREFSPFEILFFRFALAVVALYLIYPKRMKKTTRREELLFAAAGLSGVTLYFLLQDFALLNAAVSNVGV
ncbi:MAG: DMT family transporter, partial [Oscillospiraceae bacterium]|nr:DMT family transporter [Oscillospiraceae bacterium]